MAFRPRVPKRVLDEVPDDDAEHPRPHVDLRGAVAGEGEPKPAPAPRRSRYSSTTSSTMGISGVAPSADHLVPGLELSQEQDVVDELAHLGDLLPGALDERREVGVGQLGRLEQRQQASKRRAKLVRDGGREARAQLLVRPKVAGAAQVHDALRAARRPRTAPPRRPPSAPRGRARPAGAAPPRDPGRPPAPGGSRARPGPMRRARPPPPGFPPPGSWRGATSAGRPGPVSSPFTMRSPDVDLSVIPRGCRSAIIVNAWPRCCSLKTTS